MPIKDFPRSGKRPTSLAEEVSAVVATVPKEQSKITYASDTAAYGSAD